MGVVKLGHEAKIGQSGRVAETIVRVGRNQFLEGGQAAQHPVIHPHDGLFLAVPHRLQSCDHPQVVHRMDVGGDGHGGGADLGPAYRIRGQERRVGLRLFQPIKDGHRLGQHRTIAQYKGRDSLTRIEFGIVPVNLIACDQIHRDRLVSQTLEVQCDPHAVGGGRPPVGIEPHFLPGVPSNFFSMSFQQSM